MPFLGVPLTFTGYIEYVMELNKLLIKSKMNKAYNEASNHLKIWQDTYYAILFFFFLVKRIFIQFTDSGAAIWISDIPLSPMFPG